LFELTGPQISHAICIQTLIAGQFKKLNQKNRFQNSFLQKAAGYSGHVGKASALCFFKPEQSGDASPTYLLPEPASLTNLQGFVSDAG